MDQLPGPCVVLLHVGLGPSQLRLQGGTPPPVTERFSLRDDLWIEQLPEPLATAIQRACDPPHYNIDNYVQDRHLYAFVRRLGNIEPAEEGVRELFALAALSRLAHPTSIGHRYCANVHFFGANDSPVHALQYRGISPDAILAEQDRDWLSIADATVLRDLLPWLSRRMHKRVHRAYLEP